MPDNLTTQFKAELKRRGITASNTEVSDFISQRPDLFQSVGQPMGDLTPRKYEGPPELLSGPVHFAGAALWNFIDTALFSIPSISMGEDAPYKHEELGAGAKAGAVFGQAGGFLVPFGALSKGTKAIAAAGKYGTKKATQRAARQAMSRGEQGVLRDIDLGNISDVAIGKNVSRTLKSNPAKDLLPRYEISTSQIETVSKQMQTIIGQSLKKEFPNLADDVIGRISSTATSELGRHGVHLNTIAKRVENALGTKFKASDSKKITSYVARAAEMSVNFSLYNLLDDAVKSGMLEGHEFDPVADVGHALLFSAFLPLIEAIPSVGGRESMMIFKTRKVVKKGLDKIKAMDYDNMSVDEINTLFKIISNNNAVKYSEMGKKAAENWRNAFKPGQEKIAAKHMKAIMQNFRPDQAMRQFYKEVGKDIGTSLPRMTAGALFFNASTLIDSNILRNVDPETLGAHLLVGALFTRRYKPIRRDKAPTLNEFDRKVEFLRLMGMDATQLRILGKVYDHRADMAYASMGLLNHPIYRQINEAINTKEHTQQTKDGKDGIGSLDGANHNFLALVRELFYIPGERSRKIMNEDADINSDVLFNRLTIDQLNKLDRVLRQVDVSNVMKKGDKLNESNIEEVSANIWQSIVEGTHETTMKMTVDGLKELGLSADVPTTGFNINKPLAIKTIKGLEQYEGKEGWEAIHEFDFILRRLKAYGLVDVIRETEGEARKAHEIDINKVGPKIESVLSEFERKMIEDNYDPSAVLTNFDRADNAFIKSLATWKLGKTQSNLYNIIEGKTESLNKEAFDLREFLYELMPRGTEVRNIKQGDKTAEEWKKIQDSGDFTQTAEVIFATSELLNLGGQTKLKSKDITYEEAKTIVDRLSAEGYKITTGTPEAFTKYYFRRLLNSSNISVRHIAMIKQLMAHQVGRVVNEHGKNVVKIVDIQGARQILGPSKEATESLRQYDIILKELKAVNGEYLRVDAEFDFGRMTESNLLSFITETYPITTKYTRNIPDAFDAVRKTTADRVDAIRVVEEVIDSFISKTDPEALEVKPLTLNEARELSDALKKVRRDAGADLSPEFNNLIRQLERSLSLTRVGEEGMVEAINTEAVNEKGGPAMLAIKNAIESELQPHDIINRQMSETILGIDTYVGDKLSAKLRHDNLLADLTKQLRDGGIEVADGLTISELSTKFFGGNLSLEQKIDKGIKLSINDFVSTVNDHMMSWNKGSTEQHFKEMSDRYRRTLEDSSMKSRDVDYFSRLNATVNKLKPHVQYFDSHKFATEKEKLARAIKNNKSDEAIQHLDKISTEIERGYEILHRDDPAQAKKAYQDFINNEYRELLFGTAGTTTARSVKLNYADGEYLLMENKMVMSDSRLADLMREFESEGLYIAALEKSGIILNEFGKPQKVSNLFGFDNLDVDYIGKSKFSASEKSGKERETYPERFETPAENRFIRIPLSFSTQLVIPKNAIDLKKAETVLKRWYNRKLGQLEEARDKNIDLKIPGETAESLIRKFKALYGSEINNDTATKQFVKAMYHDKMNSKGFHTFISLVTRRGELNAHMANNYKYFSLAEGMGPKVAGSSTAMKFLLEANKTGKNAKELLSTDEITSIEYWIDKGEKLDVVTLQDESGKMDALELAKKGFEQLGAKEKGISKEDIAYTLLKLTNANNDPNTSSLKDRSTVDGLLYAGTHAHRLNLIQKARRENDGVGGIKEQIAYNDGINTALLKQNAIFDPRVAAVLDGLGIDFLSFGSSSKVWSKETIEPKEAWEVKRRSIPLYISDNLGVGPEAGKKLKANDYVQEIKLEDIQYVKSEDRHSVTNITYAASETLDKMGFRDFLDYANYDTQLSSAQLMREGIVSRGPERFGISEFLLKTLAEEGAIINGSTTSDVQAHLMAGMDPRQLLLHAPINRILNRTVISRIRNPETDGGSYSVLVPYLEGSLPVWSSPQTGKKSVQTRFGGKKLAYADGKIRVTNFDKIQYIVNANGREVLVGMQDGKWSTVGTGKDQLPLTTAQKKIIDAKTKRIEKLVSMWREGTSLRNLYNTMKREGVFLESASLRMPNLAGDVVINKIEGFHNSRMGNVVGVNIVDLVTKMQADLDGDMTFSYHDMPFRLTKAYADITGLRFDARVYEPRPYDFGDLLQNGEKGYDAPVGSKPDSRDPVDVHNVNYFRGKDSFGQMKRLGAGINSLARTDFYFTGEKGERFDIVSFKEFDKLAGHLQRYSNTLQSLIDTTKRSNMTNEYATKVIKRFVLFGDIPGDIEFNAKKYGEGGYEGLIKIPSQYRGVQQEIMKDGIIEIIDALGRPSRIMSDIQDASGRRMPDQADLIRMNNELKKVEADPSQYVFSRLVRKYDKEMRDNLLEMFFERDNFRTQDALRSRILSKEFGYGKQIMVEKRPFSFLASEQNSLFDSTPGGYILKRLGNVGNTYRQTSETYGAVTKELAQSIENIENYIALSDATTHEKIMETLAEADTNHKLTVNLIGEQFRTKIKDIKGIEDYSIKYYLLGQNASGIRDYLRRNSRSSSENVSYMRQKLMRIEALREHMRLQEDGLIGDLLKANRKISEGREKDIVDDMKPLVKRFGLIERKVTGKKARLYRNTSRETQYIYSESYNNKGKWIKSKAIRPKQTYFLEPGRHVILERPLSYDPLSKAEVLDAYSLFLVTGDVTPENIRGFSGDRIDISNFMAKSDILKARISALSAETFRISQGHPEGSENWVKEKEFEDMLVKRFFETFSKGYEAQENIGKDISTSEYTPLVHDIALYLMKPNVAFGKISYVRDVDMAMPSFKVNKRVSSAVLRYLRNEGHEEIYKEIVSKWGTEFKRRYSNIPDAGSSSMYTDTIYRSKNTALKEKSEVYNLIASSTPSLLYKPAIIEALKDEISLGKSKMVKETDVHGDVYKILRLGTYENIKVDLSPYVDPKGTDHVSNIFCI